jgi:hypothetical protein
LRRVIGRPAGGKQDPLRAAPGEGPAQALGGAQLRAQGLFERRRLLADLVEHQRHAFELWHGAVRIPRARLAGK